MTRWTPKEVEGAVVQDCLGGPAAGLDRKEDWELNVTGYSERMGRPIVSGWSRRDLQDKASDLDRVECQITYVGTAAPYVGDDFVICEWTLSPLVSRDSDEDAGGGSELGPH